VQTLIGFKTLLGLLAIAMPRLVDYCMGVTITHPLPPLKRGGLNDEAQFVGISVVIL
jgi:hypothetical protein